MKKRLISVLLGASMLLTLFAGCGKSSDSGSQPSDQPADEVIELTIMSSLQTENEAELETAIAEEYMKENPNIKIKFIAQKVNDLPAKIIALNTSNELPDAFLMPSDFIPQAYKMGILKDPREYLGDDFLAQLPDSVLEYGMMEDTLTIVPWYMIPQALIYRTDWLEEAGIDSIETMDDFVKTAQAFTNGKDRWGFSMVGTNNGSGYSRFIQYARAFGVDTIYQNENGEWECDLVSDKYRDALQSFVDLDVKYGTVPPGSSVTGYPEAVTFFAQNQTGLIISGSNAIGSILSQNPDLDGKIASVPIPKQDRHVTNLQIAGYSMTTNCKHPQELADYLKFMVSKENSVNFAKQTGRLPVTKEALEDEAFKTPTYQGFIDAIPYAMTYPPFGGFSEILDIMGESYNSMLSGVSLDEAMANVEKRVKIVMDKYAE